MSTKNYYAKRGDTVTFTAMGRRPTTMVHYNLADRGKVQEIARRLGYSESSFIDHCIAGIIEMIEHQGEGIPTPNLVNMARASFHSSTSLKVGETSDTYTVARLTKDVERLLQELERQKSLSPKSESKKKAGHG